MSAASLIKILQSGRSWLTLAVLKACTPGDCGDWFSQVFVPVRTFLGNVSFFCHKGAICIEHVSWTELLNADGFVVFMGIGSWCVCNHCLSSEFDPGILDLAMKSINRIQSVEQIALNVLQLLIVFAVVSKSHNSIGMREKPLWYALSYFELSSLMWWIWWHQLQNRFLEKILEGLRFGGETTV